ncbi:MAG: hypothetical protein EHM61_00315 [Acidobacteria bacterium]|nr:MAG: hypothetical protein EHM61_00315 [Acidobacteriota bacterium]
MHLYYRADGVAGNQRLAFRRASEDAAKVLIETRGEGGYVIAPGSPPACHPSGKSYQLRQGSFDAIPRGAGGRKLSRSSGDRCRNQPGSSYSPKTRSRGNTGTCRSPMRRSPRFMNCRLWKSVRTCSTTRPRGNAHYAQFSPRHSARKILYVLEGKASQAKTA